MVTIKLDPNKMDTLFFLCAHDFKHDFIEDKTRSENAYIDIDPSLYQGGSITETVDVDLRPLSMPSSSNVDLRPLSMPSSSIEDVSDPKSLPLAYYIYVNLLIEVGEENIEETFDNFCNSLERIVMREEISRATQKRMLQLGSDNHQNGGQLTEMDAVNILFKLDLPKRLTEIDAANILLKLDQSKEFTEAETEVANILLELWESTPIDELTETEKKVLIELRKILNTPSKPAAAPAPESKSESKPGVRTSRRLAAQPQTAYASESEDPEPPSEKVIDEWDEKLNIYKDWLYSTNPTEFDKFKNETDLEPNPENIISYYKPFSDIEEVVSDPSRHHVWYTNFDSITKIKGNFERALADRGFPIMKKITIHAKNKKIIKNFTDLLLSEWEKFSNLKSNEIYTRKDKFNSSYKDEKLWEDTQKHYDSTPPSSVLKNEIQKYWTEVNRPVKEGGPTIINNSAILQKYRADTIMISKEPKFFTRKADDKTGDIWYCHISSVVDGQSICATASSENQKEETDISVIDTTDRKIKIKIKYGSPVPNMYNLCISLSNDGEEIKGSLVNEFNGDSPLSAYNVTKRFIKECIKLEDGRLPREKGILEPLTFEEMKLSTYEIMGIFALKLMGDFSQELYAVTTANTLYLANDRPSVARYLLLKKYGIVNEEPLSEKNNGGGYLSYSHPSGKPRQYNYFLITDGGAIISTGTNYVGGSKAKRKSRRSRKTRMKTKRKSRRSRKNRMKTKRKSRRSRKNRMKTKRKSRRGRRRKK